MPGVAPEARYSCVGATGRAEVRGDKMAAVKVKSEGSKLKVGANAHCKCGYRTQDYKNTDLVFDDMFSHLERARVLARHESFGMSTWSRTAGGFKRVMADTLMSKGSEVYKRNTR